MKPREIAALVGAAVATSADANLVFDGPSESAALVIGSVGSVLLAALLLFDWR